MANKITIKLNGSAVDGAVELDSISGVEAIAFMTSATYYILKETHKLVQGFGANETDAVAIALKNASLALERFADDVGKDTMQKAYERNSKIEEKMRG